MIRELFDELGVSRRALARACGVTAQAVMWWESVDRIPEWRVAGVAAALGVDARWLGLKLLEMQMPSLGSIPEFLVLLGVVKR